MEEHEVIVYDEKGVEIERTQQPTHVTHMVRWKHVFDSYTTYSFNTHYDTGLVHWGMVPFPPLNISWAWLK